ncbi:MAG: calponin homology domain-containing protein [Monoraphidium minutum]|nr:MAG: calponin homology domain-containing protein [Monoraphidium minutum]
MLRALFRAAAHGHGRDDAQSLELAPAPPGAARPQQHARLTGYSAQLRARTQGLASPRRPPAAGELPLGQDAAAGGNPSPSAGGAPAAGAAPAAAAAPPAAAAEAAAAAAAAQAAVAAAAAAAAAAAKAAAWQPWYDPDEETGFDDPSISREEQCFRNWINSLGTATKCGSLFGPEVRSGWLLLEVLDCLQPGCVNWALANRPPFRRDAGGLPRSLENAGRALEAAGGALGLQLVSMGPHDIVAGHRKPILSLVYQLMRYHVLQARARARVLGSLGGDDGEGEGSGDFAAAAAALDGAPEAGGAAPGALGGGDGSGRLSEAGGSGGGTPRAPRLSSGSGGGGGSACGTPRAGARVSGGGGLVFGSSSSKQRRTPLRVTETDILEWANRKIAEAGAPWPALAAAQRAQHGGAGGGGAARRMVQSFRDPYLGTGLPLLQVLSALSPGAVEARFVSAGGDAAQREANARYALALARRAGAPTSLLWSDVTTVQPRLMLVLFATLMAHEQRQRRQLAAAAAAPAAEQAAAPAAPAETLAPVEAEAPAEAVPGRLARPQLA